MELVKKIANKIAEIINIDENTIEKTIERPQELKNGNYSLPCFKFTKELKKSPQELAQYIKENLKMEEIEKIEVVSGFLNIFINKNVYVGSIFKEIDEKKESYGANDVGKNKRALIEHTSINPNASPHIGRARNAMIGDCIVNVLKFNHYDVEIHYFVNDIGKQISMLLVAAKDADNLTFENMLNLYIDINKKVKEDSTIEQEVFDNLNKLENGDKETIKRFRKIVEICINGQRKILAELGIHYDYFDYESDLVLNGSVDKVLKELEKTGKLVEVEDGRLVINQEDYNLPIKSPVLVITRADKTSLYPLRDIAYTIQKYERNADRNIVVLGEDQKLYFKQISASMDILNYPAPEVVHYSFVLLPDGKMSTRNGTVVLLEDFMKEILNKVREELLKRNQVIDEEKAKKIAYGAVKYTILKGSCEKNVIFDLEKALNFEGDTSLYIQYNYARINSILKKAEYDKMEKMQKYELLNEDIEILLTQKIEDFKKMNVKVLEKLTPNLIANYVYELTKLFSSYYHDYSILNVENEELKNMRLQLIYNIGLVIKKSLELLGIDVVDEM